ncbi:hypothetical protein FNYG_00070 [Fusarium nygamai]|uniref:Uncharacterized protein n=1 Tax=Gibberella nygamai TaxID=42673 RepID=A0A2K0WWF6_GIBNY|nr:hypothetical protein FNYG_00070 [Fusarium nygamai]
MQVSLFFLTYHHAHPTVDDEDDDDGSVKDIVKEKNRRIATKTILKGIFRGDFPATGDARGEERKAQASDHRQDCYEWLL